jgi:magnesium-transporting ATPase (P-type)
MPRAEEPVYDELPEHLIMERKALEDFHKKTVEEVVKELSTNLSKGLTEAEAEKRLKEYGPNQLEKEEEESLWDKIKESFEDLLVRILLLAAVISFIIALTGKLN